MINWQWKPFQQLTLNELYSLMALRQKVFIVEQNCPYLDADGLDEKAWHLMGWKNEQLVAYLRVLPAGLQYNEVTVGRVLTSPRHRSQGFGKGLTAQCIKRVNEELGPCPIRLAAQAHLTQFYEYFGFVKDSEEYLEDGIPHIQMILNSTNINPSSDRDQIYQ